MRLRHSRSAPLWGAACCLLLSWNAAFAVSSKDIEAKVALETSLEKRLQSVLREVLASDELIVIVNVETLSDTVGDEEVMPGVPPRASPAVPGSLALPMNMVRRISATVIVDQSVSDNDIRLVRETAAGILGITAERGDILSVDKMKFHKEAKAQTLTAMQFLGSPLGISVLWLAIILAALILLFLGFLHPLLKVLREPPSPAKKAGPEAEKEEAGAAGPEPLPAPAWGGGGLSSGNGSRRPDQPFSFITESDLWGLLFLLRQEKPLAVATVAHYAPPSCAPKLLAALAPELRREVVAMMTQVRQMDEAYVRDLEKNLRQRIQYLVGGEDKLADILDTLTPSLQMEMLQGLQARDPALVQRLTKRIVFLEDLARLDAADCKALTRLVPLPLLASVLKPSAQLRQALLPRISEGMRERLNQEIEFAPELAPAARDAACRQLLDAVRMLAREGKLKLPNKGK